MNVELMMEEATALSLVKRQNEGSTERHVCRQCAEARREENDILQHVIEKHWGLVLARRTPIKGPITEPEGARSGADLPLIGNICNHSGTPSDTLPRARVMSCDCKLNLICPVCQFNIGTPKCYCDGVMK